MRMAAQVLWCSPFIKRSLHRPLPALHLGPIVVARLPRIAVPQPFLQHVRWYAALGRAGGRSWPPAHEASQCHETAATTENGNEHQAKISKEQGQQPRTIALEGAVGVLGFVLQSHGVYTIVDWHGVRLPSRPLQRSQGFRPVLKLPVL